MEIKLRQAKFDDLEEMQELFVGTIKSTCRNDYNKKQLEVWVSSVENKERWKSILTNQYFLIAEINGKMIFEKLKTKSLELGFDKLTADVSKTALPFFETKGFKVIRENKNIINGVEIINYRMSQ